MVVLRKVVIMKASDFIMHLQQMIEEHGDLPLAMIEVDYDTGAHAFIELDGIEQVYILATSEVLYDGNDNVSSERKVFLID